MKTMKAIIEAKDFISTINSLKDRFYTVEEFPLIARENLPANVVEKSMNIVGSDLQGYASGLKGKELEALILDLKDNLSPEETQKVSDILAIRMSPRILKLLIITYQYNPDSKGLNIVLRDLSSVIERKNISSPEGNFIRRFGIIEDKVSAIRSAMDEYEMDIDSCFNAYRIYWHSPLAKEVVLSYLGCTSREGLIKNRLWMIAVIEQDSSDRIYLTVRNYLSAFSLNEYDDGINLAIMDKIGQPYISPDWEPYNVKLQKKFSQWNFLYQLMLHTSDFPKKYYVLEKYYGEVRNSYSIEEENLLVIDFGDIVIADIKYAPFSFFYEKNIFEKEIKEWHKSLEMQKAWKLEGGEEEPKVSIPTFSRMDKRNLTARDFIIEELEEPCVKLSYEGIDVLYIREMLDIKIGLEPDFRTKQLEKIKKSRK